MLIALLIFALLFHWLPGADTAVVGILRILVALVLFPWFWVLLRRVGRPRRAGRRSPSIGAARSWREPLRSLPAAVPVSRSRAFRSTRRMKPKHFKLIGATGTGKSTAIREMLTAALERGGSRPSIADPDGGYLARFYSAERGDVILNPFDG